jgi:hypothetical protein
MHQIKIWKLKNVFDVVLFSNADVSTRIIICIEGAAVLGWLRQMGGVMDGPGFKGARYSRARLHRVDHPQLPPMVSKSGEVP